VVRSRQPGTLIDGRRNSTVCQVPRAERPHFPSRHAILPVPLSSGTWDRARAGLDVREWPATFRSSIAGLALTCRRVWRAGGERYRTRWHGDVCARFPSDSGTVRRSTEPADPGSVSAPSSGARRGGSPGDAVGESVGHSGFEYDEGRRADGGWLCGLRRGVGRWAGIAGRRRCLWWRIVCWPDGGWSGARLGRRVSDRC